MHSHKNNVFSSKEVADYCELIGQYLDNIPLKTEEDFGSVACALSSLAKLEEVKCDSDLQGRISSIKEILDYPEMYVVKEKEEAFKALIMERIAAKVHELTNLSFQKKEREIEKHEKKEIITKENQARISQSEAPQVGSEAHTISEEEYLRELQTNFNQNAHMPAMLFLEDLFRPRYEETVEQWRRAIVVADPTEGRAEPSLNTPGFIRA